MLNRAMQEKLKKGQCLNVLGKVLGGTEVEPGVWQINQYVDNIDYCVVREESDRLSAVTEESAPVELWIWSIGKRYDDGKIFAAVDGRFYQNPEYECLWLR